MSVTDLEKRRPEQRRGASRRSAEKKAEIIEMAAQCFMERGFHATSLDDVARRLGSTKGRIYYYYPTKTALFFDVHREGMARLFASLDRAMETVGDGLTVLREMLTAHACTMFEHHTFENVVAQGVQLHRFGATTPEERETLTDLIASRDLFESRFKEAIAAAIADGSLRKVDVSITAKTLLGALQWSIFWYRPRPEDTPETRRALAEKMVAPLIDGLRSRPEDQ